MDLLQQIVLFLAAGMVGIAAARMLRVSPILGFFFAGALIGHHGLGLVEHTDTIHLLGELGVAFLLFDIGLHLSMKKVWESRRDLIGLGPAQVGITTLLAGGLCLLLGVDLVSAFVLGAGFSLSSTAIVLKVLQDRDEQGTPLGKTAVAVLVFQDIFVVFLLTLVPALASDDVAIGPALADALLRFLIALAAVAVVGRFLLHPLFQWIAAARNDELFTFAALLFVLSIAWGTSELGLSLPLGAFLAGLALSESRFAYLVQSEVAPFRALLLSLFFITVGMSLDLHLFVEQPLAILGLSAALIALKSAVLLVVSLGLGRPRGFAVQLSLLMAQGSEFAFVLFGLAGAQLGLFDASVQGLAVAVVSVTLAVTPLLAMLGAAWGARLERRPAAAEETAIAGAGKVVIVGFDDVAARLARILAAEEVDYVALTGDRERVAKARCEGLNVELGSPERPRALGLASIGEARSLVVLVPTADVARAILASLGKIDPSLPVFVATSDLSLFEELQGRGLRDVLAKSDNTAFEIARQILLDAGRESAEVERRLEEVRREGQRLSEIAELP